MGFSPSTYGALQPLDQRMALTCFFEVASQFIAELSRPGIFFREPPGISHKIDFTLVSRGDGPDLPCLYLEEAPLLFHGSVAVPQGVFWTGKLCIPDRNSR